MPRIACLHTAESNIAVFDAALERLERPGIDLRHHVRSDLLADAERAGGLTAEIAERTAAALRGLYGEADAVLLTCSTLGAAADAVAAGAPIPIVRVDAALAREAVKDGGQIAVLCTVETTIEPTRILFAAAARATGAEVRVQLVPQAWAAFRAGDHEGYLDRIARVAEAAARAGAERIALAQASMAAAADRTRTDPRPLTSPQVGLAAVVAVAS